MSRNLFITGTGTDVGKTFVSALIVKKLSEKAESAYFKAAMSGNIRAADGSLIPGDAKFVKDFSGIAQDLESMCPFVYENAYSPHLASRIEGNPVNLSVIKNCFESLVKKTDFLTVEGSGGILCPIDYERDGTRKPILLEDVIKTLNLSSVLVADAGLGTINSVVLTARYMESKNLELKGIIFNRYHKGDIMEEDNIFMCEKMTGLKVLSCVEENAEELTMTFEELSRLYA